LLTTGLNAGAARISRKYIFLNRSSSSFIARLSKGADDIWKTVRVSMSDGVTERGAGSARIVPGAKPDELVRESGWAAGRQPSQGESAMTYFDTQQQYLNNPQFNPQQWAPFNSHAAQSAGYGLGGYGLGQAAFGQPYGQYGGQPSIGGFGYGAQGSAQGWGQQQQPQWGGPQQRQLSQQDVSEVVRQLVPALPQILAQAQSPHAGVGYAAYGQAPRLLSQQDVNEVVRQILPIVPQIVGMLQGQPQLQYAAMQGGTGLGQFGLGNPAQNFGQSFGTQFGIPQFQAAFGAPGAWGQQRQLTQQDVADVTRQLIGVIPQIIGNLQAFNQPRMN
jgi:hypothetical protein